MKHYATIKHRPKPGLPPWKAKCKLCGWSLRTTDPDMAADWPAQHFNAYHVKAVD